jgi:anaerobic magnesium-protoporphyrin IX monomethyl ester cyclase
MMDAILIADSGAESLSATNPLRLSLHGRTASVQVIRHCLTHEGKIVEPIEGEGTGSWSSGYKLNGIFLFSYLTRQGFEIELINSYYDERDRFREMLDKNPGVIIISTTFIPGKKTLRKLVADIRNLAPHIFIVAGGPLAYLSYLVLKRKEDRGYDTESAKEDFLFLSTEDEPLVDIYIISLGGEQILEKVLTRLKRGDSLEDIPNTVHFGRKGYSFSGRWDDSIPARGFSIEWQNLPDSIFKSGVVPLQASTGCPYRCAFCNFTKDRRLNGIKPIEHLVEEIREVCRRGARYVWFVDDNFRLGKHDLNAVCERFLKENLQFSWMTFVRASTLKEVDMQLLRAAGCWEVQLGLESADRQVLRNMNKRATPELYSKVLQGLLEAGIHCSCYFIVGFPGETTETARCTREFIRDHQFEELEGNLSWSIFPFIFTPLSPIYEPEMRQKYGLTGYMYRWQHETMNSDQARELVLKTFLELEHSGPIYRDDNLDMLRSLEPYRRKMFESARHRLSKAALQRQIGEEDILRSFTPAFSGTRTLHATR